MADTFRFALLTPEKLVVPAAPAERESREETPKTVDVTEVIIPGQEGDLAALPRHALLITQLRPGVLTIPSLAGVEAKYYLRGGFADLGPSETVVLAEYAIPLAEFTSAMLTDEIALAQQAYDDAATDDARYRAADTLERVTSLRPQLGYSAT